MSITVLLLISIGLVSYLCFSNEKLFNQLLFSPYVIIREKEWFRFITGAWVHSGLWHLAINLFVLYMFGETIEYYMVHWFGNIGRFYFLVLFLASVIIAHIPTYFKEKDNYYYASVGASGGVSGVLFASILLDPLRLLDIFGLIPIPGIVFGVIYLIYSNRMAQQSRDNINHDAHFYGAIGGMLVLIIMQPKTITNFLEQITSVF